jgi:uncharacterized protein (UPF0335 family)
MFVERVERMEGERKKVEGEVGGVKLVVKGLLWAP